MDGTKPEHIKEGAEIINRGGVRATLIPVGAMVHYPTGVDGRAGPWEVIDGPNGKMLGPGWAGHNGIMRVVSLTRVQ